MPISRIKRDGIQDGAISVAKTDSLFHNTHFTGTEAAKLPVGTTAERANEVAGDQRFNSTLNLMEYYDGTIWKAIDSPPIVSSISPTSETGANADITITGNNFQSGATVKFIGNDGTEYDSPTVTRNSSTELVAQTPSTPLGSNNEPYDIKVINPSSLSGTLSDALDAGSPPTFDTAAGAHTMYDIQRSDGFDASATDPDGDTITYSLQSGSLPAGATLNTSTGIITGMTQVGGDTTSTFTIRASTASGDTTDRQFVLTVKAPVTQTFNTTSADQSFSIPSGLTKISATMWGAGGGGSDAEGYQDSGGAGGYATGDIDVSSMSSLVIAVGKGGQKTGGSNDSYPSGIDGAENGIPARSYYKGGKASNRVSYVSGNGGGLSGIFNGSLSFANSLLIAGGGGGAGGHGGGGANAGNSCAGGNGGYYTSTSDTAGSGHTYNGTQPSNAGTLTQAGATVGLAGQLHGGDRTATNAGGGGGSGYYGGGQGSTHGGGGGGSSYYNSTYVSNQAFANTATHSGKQSSIAAPNNSHSLYSSGVGTGNANADGGNGKVVISY